MKEEKVIKILEVPKEVELKINGSMIKAIGPKGELQKKLIHPKFNMVLKDRVLFFSIKEFTKKEKVIMGTFRAHIKNLIKGVSEGFLYNLKICSGHFPMNVSLTGDTLIIKNFLGEKTPRKAKIKEGVKVDIKGDQIEVYSISKEDAGQTAANIEISTRITNRDKRVFQDGIYITTKAGKESS